MKLRNAFLFSLLFWGTYLTSNAQGPYPPNLNFETGITSGWTCYKGKILTGPVWSLTTCTPVPTLHTVTALPDTDYYGGFPVVGAGLYSLKIGKDSAGGNADGAEYHIHVPATGNFELTYRYAVVMEDPGHSSTQQPRFLVTFSDSATGTIMTCSSATFVAGALPGFSISSLPSRTGTGYDVYYKNWTTAYANLDKMSGKTVIANFKVAGCVPASHWGYAYLDFDTGYSYGLIRTSYAACHATTDTLTAPPGYSSYQWYDSATFTHLYGTTRTAVLTVPTVATTYAVIVMPAVGFGCPDTLYTTLIASLFTNQSHDTAICSGTTISLKAGAAGIHKPITYSWTPALGLSCSTCDTVTMTPPTGTTKYAVTVTDATGCSITDTIKVSSYTVLPAITGSTSVCIGLTTVLTDAATGGSWSSSNTAVATIGTSVGLVTTVSAGTANITYSLAGGCFAFTTFTVLPIPTITITSYSSCSNVDSLVASGGGPLYIWSPSTGLSSPLTATTLASPPVTTTYTLTALGTCKSKSTITVNGDKIFGHITFGGPTPDTLDMKVWLIQYNPADSSIKAVDSTLTCVFDSMTYYEFDGKPSGNYMVKAKLLFGNPPGSSGYVPTYSLSTSHWDSGATVTHAGGSDSLHITMVYGTVPAGPGFIGGYVYSGAGKGTTADAPMGGMLILLEDAAFNILSHTYTDGTGAYSFGNVAYGDYLIYPEDYDYKTTYAPCTINDAKPALNSVDFRQYLTSKIIKPYKFPNGITPISSNKELIIFPNPTSGELNIQWTNQKIGNADLEITDIIGRKLYKSVINMNASSGQVQVNVNGLNEGVYMITIKSDYIYYCGKLMIEE